MSTSRVILAVLVLCIVDLSSAETPKAKLTRAEQVAKWLNGSYTKHAKKKCIIPVSTHPDRGIIEDRKDAFAHSCEPALEAGLIEVDQTAVPTPIKCCHAKYQTGHTSNGDCVATKNPHNGDAICRCVPNNGKCDGAVKSCCAITQTCDPTTKKCLAGPCLPSGTECGGQKTRCCSGECKTAVSMGDVYMCK